ncbi:MAG: YraN family protein [Myxococcales bacterium]|nr:YraN family protein [Myxococcales bacterium]
MVARPTQTTHQKGQAVEAYVASWLGSQGYTIVQRNFRCRLGELDIIAEHGDYLVFVEVRSRGSGRYGAAVHAISPGKAAQVAKVAACYLAYHGGPWASRPKRFDVVAVTSGVPTLLQDAFRLGEQRYRYQ